MRHFSHQPQGAFSLAEAMQYFGGWPTLSGEPSATVMTFPVEGWRTSAAVVVRQDAHSILTGDVHLAEGNNEADAEAAWRTALAALSADIDGAGFPDVGRRDPIIDGLQARFGTLRPVCFHSPYEAAAGFIIGHRLTIAQTRSIRAQMAREHGDALQVGDEQFWAFPRPQVLLELERFGPVAGEKMERLHGIAQAALAGRLDRERLRALPFSDALTELLALRGVGPFIAMGTLIRGAGLADEVSDDDVSRQAVQHAYGLTEVPDRQALLERAEVWRPYRAWAMVLLHLWLRREGGPAYKRPGRR